jgi:hypothetical protein
MTLSCIRVRWTADLPTTLNYDTEQNTPVFVKRECFLQVLEAYYSESPAGVNGNALRVSLSTRPIFDSGKLPDFPDKIVAASVTGPQETIFGLPIFPA